MCMDATFVDVLLFSASIICKYELQTPVQALASATLETERSFQGTLLGASFDQQPRDAWKLLKKMVTRRALLSENHYDAKWVLLDCALTRQERHHLAEPVGINQREVPLRTAHQPRRLRPPTPASKVRQCCSKKAALHFRRAPAQKPLHPKSLHGGM